MKTMVTFLAINFCFILNCSGQVIKLDLIRKNDSTDSPSGSTIYLYDRYQHLQNEPFYTIGGDTIINYSIYQLPVQRKVSPTPTRYDSVLLLIGYRSPDLIMMVDKNRNYSFADDTVYKVSLLQKIESATDLKNKLPLISIDSTLITNEAGETEFKTLSLKFSPTPGDLTFYKDTIQLATVKNFNLAVYLVNYFLSSAFKFKNASYQLKIISGAITSSVFPYIESAMEQSLVSVIELAPEKKLLTTGVLKKMIDNKEPLRFGDNNLSVIAVDYSKNQIQIKLDTTEHLVYKDRIKTLSENKYFNAETGKTTRINPYKKEYTILEFSGSWCKPCVQIIPEVKRVQTRIDTSTTQFITVAIEEKFEDAKKFRQKYHLEGTVLFQELGCRKPECITRIFEVSGYPTFIVFDRRGKLLFHEITDGAIGRLSDFLKNLPPTHANQ